MDFVVTLGLLLAYYVCLLRPIELCTASDTMPTLGVYVLRPPKGG